MNIVLHGLNHFVCMEFKQRAIDQMLHKVTLFDSIEDECEVDIVISFYLDKVPDELIYFCKKKSIPLLLIRPWSPEIPKPFFSQDFLNVTITIRDLLIPSKPSKWGPLDVENWLTSLESGEKLDETYPSRFWVSLSDAIEAILVLIENEDIFGEEIVLSGRRSWNPKEVISELEILWNRFVKIKSNEIGITELEIQEPLLLAPSFVGEKPNLDRLHHLLKEINGHGWKPRTPMRVTLMKCLAEIE